MLTYVSAGSAPHREQMVADDSGRMVRPRRHTTYRRRSSSSAIQCNENKNVMNDE